LNHVGDLRQCGMMIGLELVANKETGQRFPIEARTGRRVALKARERNVIIRPLDDVVVLMPPLSIAPRESRDLVSAAAWAISEVCEEHHG
jgi:adenosylmethionine-8-amino-7-oxononanoate aminotransferase